MFFKRNVEKTQKARYNLISMSLYSIHLEDSSCVHVGLPSLFRHPHLTPKLPYGPQD